MPVCFFSFFFSNRPATTNILNNFRYNFTNFCQNTEFHWIVAEKQMALKVGHKNILYIRIHIHIHIYIYSSFIAYIFGIIMMLYYYTIHNICFQVLRQIQTEKSINTIHTHSEWFFSPFPFFSCIWIWFPLKQLPKICCMLGVERLLKHVSRSNEAHTHKHTHDILIFGIHVRMWSVIYHEPDEWLHSS